MPFSFFPFPAFFKFCSAWTVEADRTVSDPFHAVDCCRDYVRFVAWIESYEKNPRKPVISLAANFTEIYYVKTFH